MKLSSIVELIAATEQATQYIAQNVSYTEPHKNNVLSRIRTATKVLSDEMEDVQIKINCNQE